MLFKDDGNIDIACLCVILLLEADYNWVLKELINHQLLQHTFCFCAIPEENFGSVQDGMSSALAVCRCLNWDVLQQCCWAGGLVSIDVSTCYD
eukprot:14244366-Ditylum_brightwellii.AAC.1